MASFAHQSVLPVLLYCSPVVLQRILKTVSLSVARYVCHSRASSIPVDSLIDKFLDLNAKTREKVSIEILVDSTHPTDNDLSFCHWHASTR